MTLRRHLSVAMITGLAVALAGASAAVAVPSSHTVGSRTTIEAEDFSADGYSDTTGKNLGGAYRKTGVDLATGGHGYYVGWTATGEWLEYRLDVTQSARYTAALTLASNQSTPRTFRVELDGRDVTGSVQFTGAGWLTWKDAKVDLGTISAGKHTLRIVFLNGKLDLDRLQLSSTSAAAAPAAPTGSAYPGRPAAGDVHWGAFYRPSSGSADPRTRYESSAGHQLEIHRSYFSWGQRTTSMINTARTDIAAGRIPWVSIKPPSWAAMASGSYDAQIDQMLRALDALNGPVWLTIHHEPEGGGGVNAADDPAGPAGHLAMNRQVRERMDALGVDNIALAPILMEWTFNPLSGRNASQYWAPGVYDFLGIDTYALRGESLIDSAWQSVRTWAGAKGVDIAVAEYGISGTGTSSANVMREFYNAALKSGSDGKGGRVVGITVFDSGPKGWLLSGSQLSEFREILSEQ